MSKEENKKPIAYKEYDYKEGEMIEVPGKFLVAVIDFLEKVKDNETSYSFLDMLPKEGKLNKEKTSVKIEWEQWPTATAYFTQQMVQTTSMIGVVAKDLHMLALQGHLENIEQGVAHKIGTITAPEKEEVKL